MAAREESKESVRARIRARRSERSPAQIASRSEALARQALAVLPPSPITATAYRAMPTEPGTGPLIEALLERGDHVLLPRISGRALHWVAVTDETSYARGPLGIMEPTGPSWDDGTAALLAAAVLFLPGLAVDSAGRRLGQGGGYYDTALATVPGHADGGPLRVAVLFDDEFVDEVPHEPHDCLVDAVLTPRRLVWIAADGPSPAT